MKPDLFAPAATVQTISRARAIAVLIGGYDGSGNYGDIALAAAALDLVGRLGPDLVAMPMLERACHEEHLALSAEGGVPVSPAIYFDGGGEFEDDLLPLAAPVDLAFGSCYLYGGGYLNGSWGERKLAMLGAAERLLDAGGAKRIHRISSGLQVEADWTAGLGEEDAATLRSFDLHGARDRGSVEALAVLESPAPVRETADDAVGVLKGLRPAAGAPAVNGSLRLNLHFAEHDWVSECPEILLDFYAGFVAELCRLADRPVRVQPLIAYLDRRIDEHAAVERLRGALSTLGVEVADPLVLRPASLAEAAPQLSEASATLSCSYHVALTSLMLEVPTVLIGDNAYYAQKAAGLAADFDLPPAFTPAADADPSTSAREIAPALFDAERAAALRRKLAREGRHLRLRRDATEAELLARLGGAALSALSEHAEALSERLRQRSAEPAELHARVAEMQTELEQLRHLADESPLDAELRVQEADARTTEAQEILATALGSRSWRLTAPLRRPRSFLRHRVRTGASGDP